MTGRVRARRIAALSAPAGGWGGLERLAGQLEAWQVGLALCLTSSLPPRGDPAWPGNWHLPDGLTVVFGPETRRERIEAIRADRDGIRWLHPHIGVMTPGTGITLTTGLRIVAAGPAGLLHQYAARGEDADVLVGADLPAEIDQIDDDLTPALHHRLHGRPDLAERLFDTVADTHPILYLRPRMVIGVDPATTIPTWAKRALPAEIGAPWVCDVVRLPNTTNNHGKACCVIIDTLTPTVAATL